MVLVSVFCFFFFEEELFEEEDDEEEDELLEAGVGVDSEVVDEEVSEEVPDVVVDDEAGVGVDSELVSEAGVVEEAAGLVSGSVYSKSCSAWFLIASRICFLWPGP